MSTVKARTFLPLVVLMAAAISHTEDLRPSVGTQITPFLSFIAEVPGVSGITIDQMGNIYAVSCTRNTITRLSPEGEILGEIGPLIGAGINLGISPFQHPIHVDNAGRIYTPSGGYLLILDQEGNLLNRDSGGKIPDGFRIRHILWLSTDATGRIYIYPPIGNKESLITVLDEDGSRLLNFGDTVLPANNSTGVFHITMDPQGNVYALFSRFAAMMKYGPDRNLQHLVKLRMNEGTEEHGKDIGDQPIDRVLLELAATGKMHYNKQILFLDIHAIDRNTVLCLTGDQELRWYSGDGRVLRAQRIAGYFRGTGTSAGFDLFAVGPDGNYIIGIDERQGKLFRVSLQ